MTTIAANLTCMAGDRQYTTEAGVKMVGGPKVFRLPSDTATKMFKHPDAICGVAGSIRNISRAIEYFNGGKFPKLSDDFISMFLVNGKLYESLDLRYFMPLEATYHAIGSGHKFAFAALAIGNDPSAAVNVAHKHDIYTGPLVDVIST